MSEKNPLVTVIVPCRSIDDGVLKLLQDIKNQTYKNIEVIIIIDSYNKEIEKIIKQETGNFLNLSIKINESQNNGPSVSRNIGIHNANGEYIRFLDSDDRIPIDSTELMVKNMLPESDLLIGNFISNHKQELFNENRNKLVSIDEFSKLFLMHAKSFYYGVVWNKLYRTEIIKKSNIAFREDFIWCEDLLFNLEYYQKCKGIQFFYTQNGIYEYKNNESGIVNKNIKNNSENPDVIRINKYRYKKLLEYSKNYNFESEFELYWYYGRLFHTLSELAKMGRKEFYVYISNEKVLKFLILYSQNNEKHPMLIWFLKMKFYGLIYLFFRMKNRIVSVFPNSMDGLKRILGMNFRQDY